jgi:hypothetical protein
MPPWREGVETCFGHVLGREASMHRKESSAGLLCLTGVEMVAECRRELNYSR